MLACRVVEADRLVSPVRLHGVTAGQRDPPVGARAVRVATHDPAGDGAPLPVRRVRSRVAAGHQPRRPSREPGCPVGGAAVGVGSVWSCQHLTVASVAEALAVSWNTANDAVLAEGRRVLINDPHRFDGVTVDRGRRTLLAAHPPRRQVRHRDHRPHPGSATGPARPGCWTWSRAGRSRRSRPGSPSGDQSWRDAVEVVAMDGFTGFKTAAVEELPDAVPVMDPLREISRNGSYVQPRIMRPGGCRRRGSRPRGGSAHDHGIHIIRRHRYQACLTGTGPAEEVDR